MYENINTWNSIMRIENLTPLKCVSIISFDGETRHKIRTNESLENLVEHTKKEKKKRNNVWLMRGEW